MLELKSIRTDIDPVITRALSEKRIVGTVVLVAQDGELVYQYAAGLADRESNKAMRVEALFRLASVTKAIVGAAIAFFPSRTFDPASYPSAGGGMVGSAHDLLRFFETIRRGGGHVLSNASTAAMMRNQNATLPANAQGPEPGWGFGFGGSVLVDPLPRIHLNPEVRGSGAACTDTRGSWIPSGV